MKSLILVLVSLVSTVALAHGRDDGSSYPACASVTPKCMSADVSWTSPKGQVIKGYQPGMHRKDGEGLWVDCVGKLAKKETVQGVTGVSDTDAKSCMEAYHAAHKGEKAHKM